MVFSQCIHHDRKSKSNVPEVKQVWLADDSAGGGKIKSLHEWFKLLSLEGKKFGYLVNGSKSWLIVLKGSLVTENVLRTVFCEVESTLNSRPYKIK
jgi:hypothetical protein